MKMKLFALAVSLLLLLSVFSAVPAAISYEYPPPGTPPTVDSIEPQSFNFTGPCVDTQTFTATDVIFNVVDLWAWDVKISWDDTYINITTWTLHVPTGWPADGYVILFNELYKAGGRVGLHFAVTGLAGKATNFTGTMTLATMNFKVLYEPVWSIGTKTTWITVDYKELSNGCGAPITVDYAHPCVIRLIPSKPNIEVLFSKDPTKFNLTEKKAQGWFEGQVITAYVWVSNATKLYGIGVEIQWDKDLLEIDLQQITINSEKFPMPWDKLAQCLTPGNFKFEISRPAPPTKPAIKGTFWILKMDFKVKCYTDIEKVPINGSTLITPVYGGLATWLTMVDGIYWSSPYLTLSAAKYYWTPIPYDFSQDGHVGKEDIALILGHYGETYNTTITDDNTNFGSRDNEVVAFPITSGLTLNALFAGVGLKYTYTVLVGGAYSGASPIVAVLDLADGRHIVLFPGWGARTGLNDLQFSETIAHDSGGNHLVDFVVYDSAFHKIWGSPASYPAFAGIKTSPGVPITGVEVVTRIAIQHQGANTGETDRLESLTFSSTTYNFPLKGFDFNGDLDVDIYDVVLVAKAYCNDKPPVLAEDPNFP
jgi:hypothetical protein